jgi:hypothetical protein
VVVHESDHTHIGFKRESVTQPVYRKTVT